MPVSRHCLKLKPVAGRQLETDTAGFAMSEAPQPLGGVGALGSGLIGDRGVQAGVTDSGESTIARGSSSRGKLRTVGEYSV